MPKPKKQFSRPSIDLGAPKKVWATVTADQIEVDDLIKGQGLVVEIYHSGYSRKLHLASGLVIVMDEQDQIEAYVKVSNV